jgi:8-oxo-dGTP pyrophosphatase MutT (NUDIX family)
MLGKTIISAPAGFMDKDKETPLQAAKRELEEEVGITANQWEALTNVGLGNSVIHSKAYLFLAKDLTFGKASPEEDEHIELCKMSLQEAVGKVMIGEISGVTNMFGILFLDRLKREKKL